jgi:branched-chain amino acid transport system ATP-binding protein
METSVLTVTDLHAGYGDMEVVSGVDLTVHSGELVALVGRNGAGKSTTLHAIAGERFGKFPGKVIFDGVDLSHANPGEAVKAGVVLVPEGHRVFGELTVLENLRLGGYPWRRKRRAQIGEDVDRVVGFFPILGEFFSRQAGQLSGGQQQMLAIGQALVASPRMLLLDEPSSGLAPSVVDIIYDAMRALRSDGIGVLVVDQDVERTLHTCDVVNVMNRGKIALSGPAASLVGKEEVANIVRGFEDMPG